MSQHRGNSVLTLLVAVLLLVAGCGREEHEPHSSAPETGAHTDAKETVEAVRDEESKLLVQFAKLIEANPSVIRRRDPNGNTVLHGACASGHSRVVEMLLEHGADVNATNNNGRSPLHTAVAEGSRDTAQLLLKRGAKVDARDWNGWTPLYEACAKADVGTARLLLQHGADVNARDDVARQTALHAAAMDGSEPIATLLLEWDADINAKDRVGLTPEQTAIIRGNETTAEILRLHKTSQSMKRPAIDR